jgi:glycosyltransferase involved in cell wall biosynthesis
MHPIKVSIVTPSFNQAQFLEATIVSVLNQNYKHIEYIIIDGGSTDGSIDILNRYADRLSYWVSEKDNGQAHAINKGFERCTGELFAYLNSDDLLEPDAVEKIVEAYSQKPGAAIYYGLCSTIDEYGKTIHAQEGAPVNFTYIRKTGMLPRIYQPACFFSKALLTRTPLFREDLHFVMDYELLLWLLRYHTSVFINIPVARYRSHANAKTSAQSYQLYTEKLNIQQEYGGHTWWKRARHYLKGLLRNG